MSDFNCNTEFCKQCGMDGGLCNDCVKKKCYEQGKADAIDEIDNKSFCEWTNCEDCAMWGQYDEFGEEEVCILEQLKSQQPKK